MNHKDLEERIKKSKEAIDKYPAWVKRSMKFVGGGVRRGDNK